MPVHSSPEEDIHMVIASDVMLDCVGQEVTACHYPRLKGVNRERSVARSVIQRSLLEIALSRMPNLDCLSVWIE